MNIRLAVVAALSGLSANPLHAAETQDELLDRAAQWQACLQDDTTCLLHGLAVASLKVV